MNYIPNTIPQLWNKYQENLQNGINKPYIEIGDLLLIHDREVLTDLDHNVTSEQILKIANCLMSVLEVKQADIDFWEYIVENDNKKITIVDSDIRLIYKKKVLQSVY